MAIMATVIINIAHENPIAPTSRMSVGATMIPPQVAPLKAKLMASPLRRSNQDRRRLATTTVPMLAQLKAISI